MRRALVVVLVSAVIAASAGCGNVFISGAINSVSGTVSIVHVVITSNGNGTSVTVTAVTLLNNGRATTQNFCGNVASQFPVNAFVTANFTPGSACGTVISVTIGG